MVVLIVHASPHGSTKAIAQRIGERLANFGLAVEVHPVDGVVSLEGYQAFVVGSAIHNGTWLLPAADLVRDHAPALACRPTWLYSVSSLGDTSTFFGRRIGPLARRMRGPNPRLVTELIDACSARDHRNFAGTIEHDHWGVVGNVFLRAFGGSFGDHRDWADIDAWADRIGSALQAEAIPP